MPSKGVLIASAVAGLFLSGAACKKKAPAPKASAKMVQCEGINSCKGKSACHGTKAGHACAGKNSCKGKGWIKATEKECKAKGGKVMAALP